MPDCDPRMRVCVQRQELPNLRCNKQSMLRRRRMLQAVCGTEIKGTSLKSGP
jgi:hypothetical protein